MKAKTAKEVLVAVKWILENVGWCKGSNARYKNGVKYCLLKAIQRPDMIGSCCINGAIQLVEANENIRFRAERLISRVLPKNNAGVIQFNDSKNTTKQDIIDVLNKAI